MLAFLKDISTAACPPNLPHPLPLYIQLFSPYYRLPDHLEQVRWNCWTKSKDKGFNYAAYEIVTCEEPVPCFRSRGQSYVIGTQWDLFDVIVVGEVELKHSLCKIRIVTSIVMLHGWFYHAQLDVNCKSCCIQHQDLFQKRSVVTETLVLLSLHCRDWPCSAYAKQLFRL